MAVAAGDKEGAVRGIEGHGVGAVADGRVGDDLAGVGVDDGGNFVVAHRHEAAALEITGETGRRFAGG